jgi:hypothetical protein
MSKQAQIGVSNRRRDWPVVVFVVPFWNLTATQTAD